MIDDLLDLRRTGQAGIFPLRQHFIEQMKILLLLRRRVDQAWIRGRIARLKFLDALEVARVSNNDGELPKLIELAELRSRFFLLCGGGCHGIAPLKNPEPELVPGFFTVPLDSALHNPNL